MSKRILYHGSSELIQQPIFGKGKLYNDYGRGFYCTEHLELAKEWACNEDMDGYANQYEIETDGLQVLNLTSDEYIILHWLAILIKHRKFRISTPVMRRSADWLLEHFLPDIDAFDIIIGYRADDSYFSFARAFINNEISLAQLSYAMQLGKLGEQFVLKSPKAFEAIRFLDAIPADNTIYYAKRKTRNDAARAAFRAELEKEDLGGIYVRELIQRGGFVGDTRL